MRSRALRSPTSRGRWQGESRGGHHVAHGIAIESWGPLGQGKYDLFGMTAIQEIAAAHGRTPAQIVLRWHLQAGNIVIPKSNSRVRMTENFEVFDFELSPEQFATMTGLDENRRVGGNPAEVN